MTNIELMAMLLICDTNDYSKELHAHRLGHVINATEVPLVPYACKFSFFAKIVNMPTDHTVDFSIQLVDPKGVTLARTPRKALYNVRADDQIPGVDIAMIIGFVVCFPGIHWAQLIIDNETACQVPITIRLREKTVIVDEPMDRTGT